MCMYLLLNYDSSFAFGAPENGFRTGNGGPDRVAREAATNAIRLRKLRAVTFSKRAPVGAGICLQWYTITQSGYIPAAASTHIGHIKYCSTGFPIISYSLSLDLKSIK